MSYRKLFWGILLVIIGILFILKNMGVIFFDWWTIANLWPLVLILWGISLIPVRDYIKMIISIIAIIITFAIVSKYSKDNKPDMHWNNNADWEFDFDENESDTSWNESNTQVLWQPYDSAMQYATLSFQAAVGNFKLSDSLLTDQLLLFKKRGNIGNYSLTSSGEGSRQIVNLNIEDSKVKLNNQGNMVTLFLNQKPVWDFDFEMGAANIDFDLSPYKTEKIDIEGGASSINLKLGSLVTRSTVDINAGAASIDLSVPKDAGVEVHTETVLTSRNLEGFKKISKGYYKTDNFNSAKNTIIINIDAGVSSLSIKRY